MQWNLTINLLKVYLSTQPSSLSAFVINKFHKAANKSCEDSYAQKCALVKCHFSSHSVFNFAVHNNPKMVQVLAMDVAKAKWLPVSLSTVSTVCHRLSWLLTHVMSANCLTITCRMLPSNSSWDNTCLAWVLLYNFHFVHMLRHLYWTCAHVNLSVLSFPGGWQKWIQ